MPLVAPAPSTPDRDLVEAADGLDRRAERGGGLVEYALLVGLIVLVCVAAVTLFGSATAGQLSSAANLFPE